MEERSGSGGAAIAIGLLFVVLLGFFGLFSVRGGGRVVSSPSTGPGSGYSTTHGQHPGGEPRSSEVRYAGASGEVRWFATWAADGTLDAAASGLFVGGARLRGLAADEQEALLEQVAAPPGTPLAPALHREQ